MTEQQAIQLFKCLSDPSRLQILKSLMQEDMYVERLAERLNLTAATISFHLRKLEAAGDYTARLALLEEQKSLPWQAVWEMYCQRHDTPAGSEWLESVRAYEKAILSQRG